MAHGDHDETSKNSGPLAESRMVLRLVPHALRTEKEHGDAEGKPPVIVNYAANLDPLPEGMSIRDLPDPPAANIPGAPLQALAIEIAVRPIVTTDENGDEVLTFSLNASLPGVTASARQQAEVPESSTPWNHDMHSEAVKECVARVQGAAREDRYQRLIELADTMMAPLDSQE